MAWIADPTSHRHASLKVEVPAVLGNVGDTAERADTPRHALPSPGKIHILRRRAGHRSRQQREAANNAFITVLPLCAFCKIVFTPLLIQSCYDTQRPATRASSRLTSERQRSKRMRREPRSDLAPNAQSPRRLASNEVELIFEQSRRGPLHGTTCLALSSPEKIQIITLRDSPEQKARTAEPRGRDVARPSSLLPVQAS